VRRAQAAKDGRTAILTIGLGREAELNVAERQQLASTPEYFYRAPDGEDLLAIHRAIAVAISCPAESFWGGR
jgi:hypothetical protein